jgi:Short C-terminal domain
MIGGTSISPLADNSRLDTSPEAPQSDAVKRGSAKTSFNQLNDKARKAINAALEPEEQVVLSIAGEAGSALVATERRVFVFKKGAVSGSAFGKQLNSWDYSNISGVEVKQGITTHAVVVQVPGVAPVTKFGRFANGPNSVWEAPNSIMATKTGVDQAIGALRRLIADHQRPSHVNESHHSDPIDQIKRLGGLRDQGLLTEEEFQSKKRQLLGLDD